MSDLFQGIYLSPSDLETEFGGPYITSFSAERVVVAPTVPDHYVADGELGGGLFQLPSSYSVPALQVSPLLKFKDLLKIEKTLQHVLRNVVTYSRAVWMTLTPEERSILLESYAVPLPQNPTPAGVAAAAPELIPLNNCVANQVLGFYGNAMILPFNLPIPKPVPLTPSPSPNPNISANITTKDIQDFLLKQHRKDFVSPVSKVALPTQGVLCEAVLGSSPSAETIDLTRFWNWQDSPIPQATDISDDKVPASMIPESAFTTPNLLQPDKGSIITSVNTGGGAASDDLVKALITAASQQKDLSPITPSGELYKLGAQTLTTAESARADALKTAQSLAGEALKALPGLLSADAANKDKQKKDATEAAAARSSKAAAAVKSLSDPNNRDAHMSVVDAQKDQPTANAVAKKIVTDAAGPDGLPTDLASTLFALYNKTKDGSPNGQLTQASEAFLEAFGLKPAPPAPP